METERTLGYEPTDRETEKFGYDIESRIPGTWRPCFIGGQGPRPQRGHHHGHPQRDPVLNEQTEDYRLAIVEFLDDGAHRVHYVSQPFRCEPDFDAASVNYSFRDLLCRAATVADAVS